ncbi:MAG TPA: IS200/IS605 family transposase [Pyrinomonadaceae bacterium]|jgi:REP element-mobilizing transposase RayT|nr:IS200/IS605 family transposase [Pyrinomonadaceae bacterium]
MPTLKGSHLNAGKERQTMSQSLVSLLVHLVFSTKNRADLITPGIETDLFAYMSATLKNHGSPCLAINGTMNHVHLLLSLSKNDALAAVVRELKKSSSRWIKSKDVKFSEFVWQDGYGAFSVGQSSAAALKLYIARQKEHHRERSFESELLALLEKYGVRYDEEYLWR